MALSKDQQKQIQHRIDEATEEERELMRRNTVAALEELGELSKLEILRGLEAQTADINVEILTRLDATELGKGRFYRYRRRLEIRNIYLSWSI